MTRDAFFVNRRVVPICDLILMRVRSRGDQRSHKPFQPGSTPGPATNVSAWAIVKPAPLTPRASDCDERKPLSEALQGQGRTKAGREVSIGELNTVNAGSNPAALVRESLPGSGAACNTTDLHGNQAVPPVLPPVLLNRANTGSLNGSGVTACADELPLHSAPPVSAAQGVAINCVQPVITHRHARGAVTASGGSSRGLDSTAFPAAAHDSRSRIWPALFFVLIGRCSPHLRRRANRHAHRLARWLSVSPQFRRVA